jgi:hypothetical protein
MQVVRCKVCQKGYVELDYDSFATSIESEDDKGIELSAEVKGYCLCCGAEHVFSTQGYADCNARQ